MESEQVTTLTAPSEQPRRRRRHRRNDAWRPFTDMPSFEDQPSFVDQALQEQRSLFGVGEPPPPTVAGAIQAVAALAVGLATAAGMLWLFKKTEII